MHLVNSNCNPFLARALVAAQQIYWYNFSLQLHFNRAQKEMSARLSLERRGAPGGLSDT